jgi:hypothetical protein
MKTERPLIISVALLILGLSWLGSHSHGNVGFSFGWPLSASKFVVSLTDEGAAAAIGVFCTLIGAIGLLITFFGAILNLTAEHRTR